MCLYCSSLASDDVDLRVFLEARLCLGIVEAVVFPHAPVGIAPAGPGMFFWLPAEAPFTLSTSCWHDIILAKIWLNCIHQKGERQQMNSQHHESLGLKIVEVLEQPG